MRRLPHMTDGWRAGLLALACAAGVLGIPRRTLRAQITTLATPTPAVSPVGLWQPATGGSAMAAAPNTITLRINSGAIQTLASLTDGKVNPFPSPVSITTQWDVSTIIGSVDLVGYFASPVAALAAPAGAIPSSRMQGRMRSGRVPAFTAFTGGMVNGVGTPGASLHLFRQLVPAAFTGIGQRTDDLELQLDLRGLKDLPAGTYAGTLTLRAIAY